MNKRGWLTLVLCSSVTAAWTAGPPIYSCVDGNGKKLTSDRPIAECTAREQRVLNPDGSIKKTVPPTLTHEEQAEREAREREMAGERSAQKDAIRRDRSLMARFPNEAAHNKARAAALEDVRKAVQQSEQRLATLAVERKPLTDDAEFYVGRQLPIKLKLQIDANDAAVEAQRSLIQNQRAEEVRINANFDAELVRLKKLWAGVPPGSLGALSAPVGPASAASPASSSTTR